MEEISNILIIGSLVCLAFCGIQIILKGKKPAIIMSFVFFLLFLLGYFVLAAEPMP